MDSSARPRGLSAVILAGGRSTRFGTDKASVELLGRPMVQWVLDSVGPVCSEVVVVAAEGQVLPPLTSAAPLRHATDLVAGKGPIAGVVEGLRAATGDLCFVTSCDVPLLATDVVSLLAASIGVADICCARVSGRLQPLTAVYRRETCLPVFLRNLARDRLALLAAYDELEVVTVEEDELAACDPTLGSFLNVNRPERLADAAAILAARGT